MNTGITAPECIVAREDSLWVTAREANGTGIACGRVTVGIQDGECYAKEPARGAACGGSQGIDHCCCGCHADHVEEVGTHQELGELDDWRAPRATPH